MKLLLDTHIVLWWMQAPEAIMASQRTALEQVHTERGGLCVAAISLWEIAKLAERGRLTMHRSVDVLLEQLETHPSIEIIPLSARIALESTRLPATFPRDPADQLIAATARAHGLRLVTADERIRRSGVVAVV